MRILPKLKRMVGLAVIKLIKDEGPYQLVQLDLGPTGVDGKPLQLRDDTYVMQHYGFVSHPPIDADAAVIALGGEANQVVVIATGDRRYRLTGLPEGGVAIHDTAGHFIKLLPDGGIESAGDWVHTGDFTMTGNQTVHGDTLLDGDLDVTGDALIEQDLGVSGDAGIDGDLDVLGDITDQAGSNTVALAAFRIKFNIHVHGGVQLGSAGNFTLVTPQQAV